MWICRRVGGRRLTGILQARFKINSLLAGILVMTGLYSVNLRIMGKSNVPLLSGRASLRWLTGSGRRWVGPAEVNVLGWIVSARDLVTLLSVLAVIVLACLALYWFFRTEMGTAMRAAGDNPQMIRALGVNVQRYRIIGLALANGLVALSGALLAQYQGFADAQMGIGMVVWGLASVIIGESATGSRSLGLAIYGAVAGSVLFRLLVAIALRWGLNPNDLKLVTALFVFAALVMPHMLRRRKKWSWRRRHILTEKACGMLTVTNIRKTFYPGTANEVRALRRGQPELPVGSFW